MSLKDKIKEEKIEENQIGETNNCESKGESKGEDEGNKVVGKNETTTDFE